MDALELAAALVTAQADGRYWRELAAVNGEQIAELREECDRLKQELLDSARAANEREGGLRTELAGYEGNYKQQVADIFHLTADKQAAKKELGEAMGHIECLCAAIETMHVVQVPEDVEMERKRARDWLADCDRRHPREEPR